MLTSLVSILNVAGYVKLGTLTLNCRTGCNIVPSVMELRVCLASIWNRQRSTIQLHGTTVPKVDGGKRVNKSKSKTPTAMPEPEYRLHRHSTTFSTRARITAWDGSRTKTHDPWGQDHRSCKDLAGVVHSSQ